MSINHEVPPICNTGALNTKSALTACVDWLEVTFQELTVEQVAGLFSSALDPLDGWELLPCGRHFYRQGRIRGSIRIYHDGSQPGMGVHVIATGQGCRQLEQEGVVESWDGPEGFLAGLVALGGQSSRIDLALDERGGLLKPHEIEQKLRAGETVSRFKKGALREDLDISGGASCGWSVRFGHATSRAGVRIYDKRAEQEGKGHDFGDDLRPWMRCELQLRDERAQEVLLLLGDTERQILPLGELVAGRLYAYLDFKDAGPDTNKSRWKTCRWWYEFVSGVNKIRTFTQEVHRTIEKTAEWIRRQVAPGLALMHLAEGYGAGFIAAAVRDGEQRLQGWQLASIMKPRPYEPVVWGGI